MINRKVVDYNTEHLEQIIDNLRSLERRQLARVRMDVMAWNDMIMSDTPNPKTVMADDKPVVIGGVSNLWNGVGEGWMIASQDIRSHMFYICKQVRKYLDEQVKLMKVIRLQAVVSVNNEDVYNFATKFLGFTYEGYLHKYGMDGSDQLMFAKWSNK
jgi:hypothetical protein